MKNEIQMALGCGPARVRVRRKWALANDIVGLELVPSEPRALAAVAPGAHIELRLTGANGEQWSRHYSLCNAPHERDSYLLAVKLEPGSRGGSAFIHHQLQEGDQLLAGPPRNLFPLHDGAGPHLLFAGGIGITPLLAMAQHLHAAGQPFALHYFARSLDHVAFLDRLNPFGPQFRLNLGLAPEQTCEAVAATLDAAPPDTQVYVCGPAPLISAVQQRAVARLGAANFHCEYFAAAPATGPAAGERAFVVQLRKSGVACRVEPGQSIVQALEAAGHAPSISCEQGVCGTCLTAVIAGTPDHRDAYLNPAERAQGDQMLICVSRALSPTLILDL